uniref:DNA polymerase delta subunit 3 n=1 Tax=Strongyloides stercoralis TaxID=6248 RepID=A0AAF5CSK5_STRER
MAVGCYEYIFLSIDGRFDHLYLANRNKETMAMGHMTKFNRIKFFSINNVCKNFNIIVCAIFNILMMNNIKIYFYLKSFKSTYKLYIFEAKLKCLTTSKYIKNNFTRALVFKMINLLIINGKIVISYQKLLIFIIKYFFFSKFYLFLFNFGTSIILSGSPDSYARFPKWAQTFENTLTFEFKTNQRDALLFYTDDGNIQGNFYCLTISDSKLQLDFRIGDDTVEENVVRNVLSIRIDDINVNDNKWHKFTLFQGWENVKIQVDDTAVFKTVTQRSFIFGNLRTNSDVFIGGIPKDINLLQTMSSPLRRYTKRFSGSVKNIIYRLYPQGISSPQLIDSKGTRHTDDDYCTYKNMSIYNTKTFSNKYKIINENYCLNNGRCYSTNEGSKCDCAFTNHEGNKCEKEKKTTQLSFFGNEWLGYDVTKNISAITNSKWENITFNFKTTCPNCMMFSSGDNMNNMEIHLQNGVVFVYSQFYGSDQRVIRIFNKKKTLRFDDGDWHSLNLYRDLIKNSMATTTIRLKLTVDEYTDEIKQNFENKEYLGNGYIFIGGVPNTYKNRIGNSSLYFKGCMSILKYEANSQLFDMIELSDEGFSKSIIRTEGELSYFCSDNPIIPDVISFTSGKGYISLPKWNSLSTGSLAFQFKTNNYDGLILYHGMPFIENANFDFIAFEIVDGYLWMILNLGSGIVRLQTSPKRLDDGEMWHTVEMERLGRTGSIIVDGQKTDFSTPGVSSNLIIDEPIYLGGAPFHQNTFNYSKKSYIRFSEKVWNGNMGKGFIGCIKNFHLNGINVKISLALENNELPNLVNHVKLGCNNKIIDSKISCKQQNCLEASKFFIFNNLSTKEYEALLLILPYQISSEAETFSALIKTEHKNGVLFDTLSSIPNYQGGVSLSLVNGELTLKYQLSNETSRIFNWGPKILNDNKWHLVSFQRRGAKLMLYLDNKLEKSYYISIKNLNYCIFIKKAAFGYSLNTNNTSIEMIERDQFKGEAIDVFFNGYNMLNKISNFEDEFLGIQYKDESNERINESKKYKIHPITFTDNPGYVMFHKETFLKSSQNNGRLSFKFRTLQKRCLLFLVERETSIISEKYVIFELINGKIYISHPQRGKYITSLSGNLNSNINLNDLKWHNILVLKDNDKNMYSLTIDNYTSILPLSDDMLFPSSGNFYFGGIPINIQLPELLEGIPNFKGCMSNLRVGKEYYSFLTDSQDAKNIIRGCETPSIKCELDSCKNNGICTQTWTDISCNCKRTTFVGKRCEKLSTTYILDGKSSIIFTYQNNSKPSTIHDELSIGFQTHSSSGTIFSIFCTSKTNNYLILYLSSGRINLKYNLGFKDHNIVLNFTNTINNGKYHILHMDRDYDNISFKLDNMKTITYKIISNNNLFTLYEIDSIVIGDVQKYFNINKQKKVHLKKRHTLSDGIRGKVSGVYFNSIKPLDLFSTKHSQTFYTGTPKLVYQDFEVKTNSLNITNDYKENISKSEVNNSKINEMNSSVQQDTDNLITGVADACLSLNDFHDSCFTEYFDSDDFITPVYQHRQDKSSSENFYTTSSGKHSRKGKHKLKATTSDPQILNIDLSSKEKFNKKLTIIDPDTKNNTKLNEKTLSSKPKLIKDNTKKTMTDNTISIEIDVPNDSTNDDDYSERWWSDIGAPTFHFITHTTTTSSPIIIIKDNIKPTTSLPKGIQSNQHNLKKLEMTSTIKEPYQLMKNLTPTNLPFSEFITKSSITKAFATLATTVINIQTTTLQPITSTPYIFSNTNNPLTTTIYAVRPTTPIGTTLSGTMNGSKSATGQQDFPRTALISIASVSVIFIIAIVVFCVFRCRQAAPGSEHYPVYVNGHKPPGILSVGGYTPVPTDMSPQMMQHSHYDGVVMPNKQHTMFTSADSNALTNCPNGHNHINVGTTIKPNLNNVSLTNGVTPCQNSYGLSNSACMSATLPNKSNSMLHRQYDDNALLNNIPHINGQLYHTIGRNGLMTSSLNKTNGMSMLETKKRAFKEWYV